MGTEADTAYLVTLLMLWCLLVKLLCLCSFTIVWCVLVKLFCSFIMLWCSVDKLLCSLIMLFDYSVILSFSNAIILCSFTINLI